MLILFQIIFSFFGLFAIGTVIQKRRSGRLSRNGMLFWMLFWVLVIGVVIYPEAASRLATVFGIGRGVDIILYVSIALLFFLLFKLHIKIETINRDITKIVRRDALEQENNKSK